MASGVRSSATRSSRPRSSIACCITPRRSTSAEKVIGSKSDVKPDCFLRRKRSTQNRLLPLRTIAANVAIRREFLRHGQIYQSDVQLYDSGRGPFRLRPESHRLDEFAASYSSAGCTPAVPASASPAGSMFHLRSRNCKPPLDQGWGIFNRQNEEFSTGVDTSGEHTVK